MARNPDIPVGHSFHGIKIQNTTDYQEMVKLERKIDELTEKIHATDPLQWKERSLMTTKRKQACEAIMRYYLSHNEHVRERSKTKSGNASKYHNHKSYLVPLCEKCGVDFSVFVSNFFNVETD